MEIAQLPPKPESNHDRLENEILWFRVLGEAIDDGDLESAKAAINAAIRLKEREKAAT